MSEQQPGAGEQWTPDRVRERLEARVEELRQSAGVIFTPEFREHARAAQREFWLALRSLIDARLEAIEHGASEKPKPPPTGRINVE